MPATIGPLFGFLCGVVFFWFWVFVFFFFFVGLFVLVQFTPLAWKEGAELTSGYLGLIPVISLVPSTSARLKR